MTLPRIGLLLFASFFFSLSPASAQDKDSAAAISSSGAEAMYYDAVRARLKGDDAAARELLLKVIKEKPDEAAPYYDLARVYSRESQPEKGIEYIKKAISLAPDNIWYQRQHADILMGRTRYAEAADIYAKLAKRNDGRVDEESASRAALLYQRAGKYKEALEQLNAVLKQAPGDENLLMQKQQVYLKMNDLEGAVGTVRELIEGNPREARYYALLADLYENNKQPEKAAEVYDEAEKKFPGDPIIQLALAQRFRDAKDTARYNTYVKRAITNRELDPESQVLLLQPYLAEILKDSSRHEEGIGLAAQLADQHPSNAAVQSFYGEVLNNFGRIAEAATQFKKAVNLDPSRFNNWMRVLQNYAAPQYADSLVVWSEKAAKLFPTQALVHFFNGIGHSGRKAYPAAIRALNRAIDLQPEDDAEILASMYTTLGDTYNSAKEYSESDSAYERALALDSKNATLLNNYAYYLSVRGVRLDDAERMSKQSLQLRPGEGTFLDTYGWILYKQGKYDDALEYIQQAIDAAGAGADGTLYDHFGDVLFRLKQTDKAVESWKKAKELMADNPLLDKKISERKLYE